MKALFLRNGGQLSLEETERPSIVNDGDVLVKVTASAICGSDLHFWKGEIPVLPDFILGHEFVGVIEETGAAVERFKKGQRVAVPAIPYCGICDSCKKGQYWACSRSIMFGVRTPRVIFPVLNQNT